MEFHTSSFLAKPHFPSSISPFLPPSSLTTLTKKTPFKFRKTHLKSFPNPPFSTNLPLQKTKKSHIAARFGRPTKRRNSLRKKLTGGDSQVRQNPQNIIDPVHHFVDNQVSDLNLSSDRLERVTGEIGSSQIDFESSNLGNSKKFGESVLWNKLEGWVDQYKKDIEFWGIGSNPIFTVFQDFDGNAERVVVDEDEILKRSGVEPLYYKKESDLGDFYEVNSKISHAKFLAKEIESGKNVIPRNSSVAKFVVSGEKSDVVSRIRSLIVPPKSLAKASKVGIAVVCGFAFVWMIRKLFSLGGKETEMSSFEKEMLRRKMKSRMGKEKVQKGSVEVMEKPSEMPTVFTERPSLDKEEVLNSIRESKGSNNGLVVQDVGGVRETASIDVDVKIREIQMMARHAREIEKGESSPSEGGELDEQAPNILSEESTEELDEDVSEEHDEGDTNPTNKVLSEESAETRIFNGALGMEILGNHEKQSGSSQFISKEVSEGNEDVEPHSISNGRISNGDSKTQANSLIQSHDILSSSNLTEGSQLNPSKKTPVRRKPKIIRSVKEAREYLLQKHDKESRVGDIPTTAAAEDERMDNCFRQRLEEGDKALKSFDADREVDSVPALKVSGYYAVKRNDGLATDTNGLKLEADTSSILSQNRLSDPPSVENSGVDSAVNLVKTMKISEMFKPSDSRGSSNFIPGENDVLDASPEANKPHLAELRSEEVDTLDGTPKPTDLSKTSDLDSGRNAFHNTNKLTKEAGVPYENVIDDANLQKKVYLSNGNGNVKHDEMNKTPNPTKESEIVVPAAVRRDLDGFDSEKKEFLPREINDEIDHKEELFANKENWLEKNFHEVEPIVKKIGSGFRDNYNVAREKIKQEVDTELDLMTLGSITNDTELEWMQDDKLKEIVFRVRDNELAGRDPFNSMDPEDKVAFYKGLDSKVEKVNQELSILHEWLHSNIENVDYGADGISIYDPPEKVIPRWKGPPLDNISEILNNSGNQQQVESSLQKANESTKSDSIETSQEASTSNSPSREKISKISKTVIEASDGSIKPGKRSGKEFWKHTKKWSRGFVESYNAEADPEVKSVMKDIGKDLDRWITEKEIKDAADLMDKIPQKGKENIEKKLSKLRREMEMFGPQAVVSKYREYAEEKEEDYLWWFDLPHLLCIELYTYDGEDQRVGFYSLEMAMDLELEPKPRHVIAFEDTSDCKNFCYIIQAHLEMIGKGKAFIVPQPPKDVFRQAKGDGFGVTVIRKGEIKLNVDQTLEEVEELITEIGSKMYHDKIMRERSVDISSLMKGVLGVSPPSKRKRKKRARKKPSKS
ncbi:hypothetical protein SOVF_073400 [Spinacia oleracea]|uniref:Embryo defective 1703 n=1 Tax=Spinacia oleracea TaxID=3562 RepID=A0A9R0JU20_SPIOL|nr:uncharacterized protein LOC110786354 [Spinacia oleracea]KNA18160.1 hypothetical protein SOVF_073400 [Spinacia oleracea]